MTAIELAILKKARVHIRRAHDLCRATTAQLRGPVLFIDLMNAAEHLTSLIGDAVNKSAKTVDPIWGSMKKP